MTVFPAPAGVILEILLAVLLTVGFPRTCGGDPDLIVVCDSRAVFSPHLRG
mgnify:CR=1 FL=1